MTTKIVLIGVSSKTHGLKGQFILHLFNNSKESILKKGLSVYLFPSNSKSNLPKEGQEYLLSHVSIGNKVIASVEGIEKIEDIEKLLPFEMKVKREDFPDTLAEDEYYCTDIVGAKVFDCNTKKYIGVVSAFYSNGAQEIAVIKNESSNAIIELPFLDIFFTSIDIKNLTIEIKLPVYIGDAEKEEEVVVEELTEVKDE